MSEINDSMTEAGAIRLALTIKNYWHERGFTNVKVWVNTLCCTPKTREVTYHVRSNLLNGWPVETTNKPVSYALETLGEALASPIGGAQYD